MYFPSAVEKYCAFIDETGNFGFNFNAQGTSSHFIVTAIIIEREKVEGLRDSIEVIRKKFFGNGEIKSSGISKDHTRRFKILSEVIKHDFRVFSLVVDKEKIYDGTGLNFKKSFIKYLNSILYKELKLIFPSLEFYADTHGSEKFMMEFEKYASRIPNYSMFDEYYFEYANSKTEPLIQLADLMSGTISFGFERAKKCEEYKGYYNMLKERTTLKTWPIAYNNYLVNLDLIDKSEYDDKIANYCLRLATKYIQEHKEQGVSSDIDKVLVLEYLMNQLFAYNAKKYISSKELIRYVNSISKVKYNDQTFKTNIIANLRDNNVIISSSANGYKIPVSKKELYSYTNMTLGMVMPMLERLDKCRSRILALTNNELDILEVEEHHKIKHYFDDIHNAL
jgi:hypothetical protein